MRTLLITLTLFEMKLERTKLTPTRLLRLIKGKLKSKQNRPSKDVIN